eukprot:scaffold3581_cov252-Pinguiococcus_pyrenoidosus.AAC.4
MQKQIQDAGRASSDADSRDVVVQLLSNDRDNLRKAAEAGLRCHSVHDFVASLGQEHVALLDVLGPMDSELGDGVVDEDMMDQETSRTALYAPHLSEADLLAGVRRKRFFRGTLRCAGNDWTDCYVVVHSETGDRKAIRLSGKENVNRAIEGDLVVIEVLPQEQWVGDPKAAKDGGADAQDRPKSGTTTQESSTHTRKKKKNRLGVGTTHLTHHHLTTTT